MAQLPQEIHELFVDALVDRTELNQNHKDETFKAFIKCTHVSRAFWLRARRHIFAYTEIRGKRATPPVSTAGRLLKFAHIATKTVPGVPPIIALVRSCSIQNQPVPYAGLWAHPAFTEVLRLLIASEPLDALRLHAVYGLWTELAHETQELLCTAFRTPHLKSLELRGFANIPSAAFDGSTIKDLTLYCLPGEGVTTKPLSALASPPPLESIETNNELPVLSNPLRAGYVPFPDLKKITSTISQQAHIDIAWDLALGAYRSLHTLDLTFMHCVYLPPPSRPFDLGQLPSLRRLRLGFSSDPVIMAGGTEYLKQLCQIIARPLSTDGPVPLESIEFYITLPHEVHRTVPSFDKGHWRALDRAVSRPHLARVRTVRLMLHFLIVGMIYGTGFVESEFVKETLEISSCSRGLRTTRRLTSGLECRWSLLGGVSYRTFDAGALLRKFRTIVFD